MIQPVTRTQTTVAWLRGFLPPAVHIDARERFRAACGMLIGIVLTGAVTRILLGPHVNLPMLIAPIGASAVLLFAVPASPLAQPWSIVGGNLAAALIGVTCAHFVPDPMTAAGLAGAGAIIAMYALRCVHPPSGAVALTAVLGGPAITQLGYQFMLMPVAINSVLLTLLALAYNNATGRRYPHAAQADAGKAPGAGLEVRVIDRLGFKPEDLDDVLTQYNQVLDVSRDDLEALFMQTEMHAYRRRFGEIVCSDIMSPNVISVEFGTALDDAWALMRRHKLKALPVVNRNRRVIGILTLSDFVEHANVEIYDTFEHRMRRLIRPAQLTHTEKPEVVGQIMSKAVRSARADMHIVELVPMLSDQGLHHMPVVDGNERLVGMLTQSDLIVALYRGRLNDAALSA